MTGKMQDGSGQQGGMPGPASNTPSSQPQQYQRTPRPQPQQPQPRPMVPAQGQAQQAPRPQSADAPIQLNAQGMPQAAPAAAGVGGGMGNGGKGGKGTSGGADDKRKRNLGILIGAIVIVVIVIVCAFFFAGNANSGFYDPDAKEGQASYKTLEEIEAERNRQMQDGMLNISIASQIEFENGSAPGTAFIENVPSNKYVLKVTITTDSNGEVVYQSGGIKPDSTIESITLSEPLAAGVYPATATFAAYDPDTLQEVGQAAAKVTLVVKN